jgi:hypothetical protein
MRVRRAFVTSAGKALKAHAVGLVEAILDPKATVEGYIALIANIPELPGILAEYTDELINEEDEEKRAETVGNLLMEAILAVSPSPKVALKSDLARKLGKAAKAIVPKHINQLRHCKIINCHSLTAIL